MAAQAYDIPIIRSQPTTKEYHYKWVLSAGVWTKTPYEYREVEVLEYHQRCDRDYPKTQIGDPGAGYELVTFDKMVPEKGFAELITVYRSLVTMTWTPIGS